ncbi:MAG: hypothetical protein JOZ27_08785 [Caulobacteraceae bacterium]|nr:hypothetical protein [Caulobacteraceae bacterium]
MKLTALAVAALALTAGSAFAQATMQPIPNPPDKPAMGHMGNHHMRMHHMKKHHMHHHMAKDAAAAPAAADTSPPK